MSEQQAEQYKAGQRQQWDSVAEGWRRWWPVFEEGVQIVSDRMVELARIGAGGAVLDIASGIGEPATTAARTVGPKGRVLATDLADEMLAIARERAREAGLGHMAFARMDAERLDVADGEFDAALCRFGLMFMPDLTRALREMSRAVRSGGRVVGAVLGAPERMPLLSLPLGVAREMFEVPQPPPGAPGPFALADPEALPAAMREAGLAEVAAETMQGPMRLDSARDYVRFVQDVTAPVRELVFRQPEAEQARYWERLEAAAGRFADGGGRITMENELHLAVGTKP